MQLTDEIKAMLCTSVYERDFSFVHKVTNTSGIIQPLPKVPLKRKRTEVYLESTNVDNDTMQLTVNTVIFELPWCRISSCGG